MLGQSDIDLTVVSLFLFFPPVSLSLVSSSPGNTRSETTPPQSTAPCSAGSARPVASPISSWVPCTRFPDRRLPQPPATHSRLSPPPVSEIASLSSCQHQLQHFLFEKNPKVYPETVISVCERSWKSQTQLCLYSSNDNLRIYFLALHMM